MTQKHRIISADSSRGVVLASLILIGAIACYNWFVAPHSTYLRAAQRYESTAETLARKSRVMNTGIAAQKERLAQLQAKFDQAREQVFEPAGAKEFFNGIEPAAEKVGCIVSSLTFSPSERRKSSADRGDSLTVRRAKLGVVGDYAGLIALIDEFQDRREKVQIDSISIESTGNPDTPAGRLDCEVTITVYIMQDEEVTIHD